MTVHLAAAHMVLCTVAMLLQVEFRIRPPVHICSGISFCPEHHFAPAAVSKNKFHFCLLGVCLNLVIVKHKLHPFSHQTHVFHRDLQP